MLTKTVVVYVSFWKRILTLFFIYVFCVSVSAQVSVNMKEEWYRRSLQNDYVT
ncbi:SGNH/GDSL hydrolase family protein, partial [Bacteroides salyersiae]